MRVLLEFYGGILGIMTLCSLAFQMNQKKTYIRMVLLLQPQPQDPQCLIMERFVKFYQFIKSITGLGSFLEVNRLFRLKV